MYSEKSTVLRFVEELLYSRDLNFKIRMLCDLCFLPVDKTESAVEKLVFVIPKKSESLVEYSKPKFIRTKRSQVRKEPLFNKTLWNCHA